MRGGSCHVRLPVPWFKPWEPPALGPERETEGRHPERRLRARMRGRNPVKLNS